VPRIVKIDGRDFRTLDEFFEVIGAALIPGKHWGKNLSAFNDILCWPLAGDPEPYVLVWQKSALSQRRLNYGAAVQHWDKITRGKLTAWQAQQRAQAEQCKGPTAFDWIVEIIQRHPDWLTLRLE
jgi:hypothetical protein